MPLYQASTILTIHITTPIVFALTMFCLFNDLSGVPSTTAHSKTIFSTGRGSITFSKRKHEKNILMKFLKDYSHGNLCKRCVPANRAMTAHFRIVIAIIRRFGCVHQ